MGKGARNRGVRVTVWSMKSPDNELSDEEWEKRFSSLNDEMASHPAKESQARWDELSMVIRALNKNASDMSRLLNLPNQDKELRKELIRGIGQSGIRDAYFDEIFRLLLNYLATVSTLIDHSRKVVSYYQDRPMYYEYAARIEKMKVSGLGPTLKGLRNYLLHNAVPPLSLNVHSMGSNKETFSVKIATSELLSSKAFDANAKKYLRERDQLLISECVSSYQREITGLYDWLFSNFEVLHGKEMRDFNKLVKEQRSIMAPPMGLDWSEWDHPTNDEKNIASRKLDRIIRQQVK